MRGSSKKVLLIFPVLITLVLFALGVNGKDVDLTMISVLSLFACTLAYSLMCGKKLIIFPAFMICFFTFVLGEWGINFLFGEPWGTKFSREIVMHVLVCIYLSILAILAGAAIGNIKSNKNQKEFDFKQYQEENKKFEGTIKALLYFTLVFSAIQYAVQAYVVITRGYIALYAGESISVPYMVQKLSDCSNFLFFSYIAILPDKKKAKRPIFIYTAINVLSILGGVRGNAVKTIILVFAYCIFRNSTDDEKWVKKKHIIAVCIAAPIAIVLLSLYNFWRSGVSAEYYGFWTEFINFFTTQGGSIQIIGYEKQLHNVLPKTNVSYSFGPIIAWYKHGFIGNIISMFTGQDFVKYSGNTIGEAMYGNNLGATITYLVMPHNYLSGIGLGTQYIAELYSDFGYLGVVLFNLFLGWFITKSRFVYFKKWFWNATTIGVVYFLFGIGREFATAFAASYVSVLNWSTVALIYALSRVKFNKKHGDLRDENTVGV